MSAFGEITVPVNLAVNPRYKNNAAKPKEIYARISSKMQE